MGPRAETRAPQSASSRCSHGCAGSLDVSLIVQIDPAALPDVKLPRIRLHDLRHTSASFGLEGGESLLSVSRRLGHSSITLTADTYSQITPAGAERAAEHLATTIAGT